MKVVCISDLQGQSLKIKPTLIPNGDILLIAGDLTSYGSLKELEDFNKWVGLLPHKHKLVIFGNHEFEIRDEDIGFKRKVLSNCTYLENELVEIEGLKIYGSPISENSIIEVPYPFRAFSDNQREDCSKIPEGIDILLTHGPPYMILDKLMDGRHMGSQFIRDAVERVKPKIHCFGHLHSNHGILEQNGTTFISAALCDDYNTMFKKDGTLFFDPVVVTI